MQFNAASLNTDASWLKKERKIGKERKNERRKEGKKERKKERYIDT